jgi:SAM-dependent methyltransferase
MWPFDRFREKPFGLKQQEKDALKAWIEDFIRAQGLNEGQGLDERNLLAYLRHHQQPEMIEGYDRLLSGLLAKTRLKRGASVLDYGCWYGVSTVMMSMLGLDMIGADINPKSIAAARSLAGFWGLGNIRFTDTGVLDDPAMAGRLDGVFIMDVLCSAHPDEIPRILKRGAGLLAPGGYIVISDYNNRRNVPFMSSLRQRWHEYEIGSGTAGAPAGHYFRMRRDHLRDRIEVGDEDELSDLARNSCYLWGDSLVAFVRALRAGEAQPRPFDPLANVPPVQAHDGCTFGTPLDVPGIADTLRGEGLETAFYPKLADAEPAARAVEAQYADTGLFIVAKRSR